MSGSSWETFADVGECSGVPPESLGVVGSPSGKSGSDREAILEVREWSRGPHGSPGVVG